MRTYQIIMRNGSVATTHNVARCNAKRAKKYVASFYTEFPGWYVYQMYKTGK
jgi:hypothetical protein